MPFSRVSYGRITSRNQGGGNKKQGLPPTMGLGPFSMNIIQRRAGYCKCRAAICKKFAFQFPEESTRGDAYNFSPDGTKICGNYIDYNNHKKPIVWNSDGTIYNAVFSIPGTTNTKGGATGFSSDGTKICGNYIDGIATKPIVWNSDGTIYNDVFSIPGTTNTEGGAVGFSSDGTKICGYYIDGIATKPIVWNSGGTIYTAGFSIPGSNLFSVSVGFSPDGTKICGYSDGITGNIPIVWNSDGTILTQICT